MTGLFHAASLEVLIAGVQIFVSAVARSTMQSDVSCAMARPRGSQSTASFFCKN